MNIIKSTFIICATILISVVIAVFFTTQQERFIIVGDKTGVFIFDHKTSATNYCTTAGCKMISPEFIVPKFTTVAEPTPSPQQQMPPQAVQSQLVNPNFSKTTTNQQQALPPQISHPPAAHQGVPNMPQQQAPVAQPGIPAQFSGVPGGTTNKQAAPRPAPTNEAEEDDEEE